MVDSQSFFNEFVLKGDHVRVFVAREMRMEAVAGLTGFAVANVVGKNQKILVGVEKLTGPEKHSSENRLKKILALPASTVKDQHRVGGAAGGVLDGLARVS